MFFFNVFYTIEQVYNKTGFRKDKVPYEKMLSLYKRRIQHTQNSWIK